MKEWNWTRILGGLLLLTGVVSLIRQDWLLSVANIGLGASILIHPTAEKMAEQQPLTWFARLMGAAGLICVIVVIARDLSATFGI